MWSWSLAATQNGPRRKNEELARYARWEYGSSDGGWLVARARREARNGSKRGLRRWFSSLLGTQTRRKALSEGHLSDPGLRTANDGGVLLTQEIPMEDCAHNSLQSLGSGGNASYYRCQLCAHVVIAQGGAWWALQPQDEE